MAEPSPTSAPPQSPPPPPPLPPPQEQPKKALLCGGGGGIAGGVFSFRRPAIRLTSEFDSDSKLFLQKASCRLFDRLAKLKLCFQHDSRGAIASPQLAFLTPNFSVLYDLESSNALLKASFALANAFNLSLTHDVKEKQGDVTITTTLDPCYKLQLSSSVPALGLPRASLMFPYGEVSLEEKTSEGRQKVLSVNGIVKANLKNGLCTALFEDNYLNLRYCYKDEEMAFIPSIALPSNALSFAFKRRFSPSDKLSYWYHFSSNDWSAVYKRNVSKDLKFKAGYDSEVQLGWASLWVGEESRKVKTAPMKMKVQLMLQVPQDDTRNSVIMFRVKKRWDF